jgi:hypothetical protein
VQVRWLHTSGNGGIAGIVGAIAGGTSGEDGTGAGAGAGGICVGAGLAG